MPLPRISGATRLSPQTRGAGRVKVGLLRGRFEIWRRSKAGVMPEDASSSARRPTEARLTNRGPTAGGSAASRSVIPDAEDPFIGAALHARALVALLAVRIVSRSRTTTGVPQEERRPRSRRRNDDRGPASRSDDSSVAQRVASSPTSGGELPTATRCVDAVHHCQSTNDDPRHHAVHAGAQFAKLPGPDGLVKTRKR